MLKSLALLALPAVALCSFKLGASRLGADSVQQPPTPIEAQEDPAVEELPPGWRGKQIAAERALRESLIGHWELHTVKRLDSDIDPEIGFSGFLSIDPEVLSFTLHAVPIVDTIFDNRVFQGGVHHWRLNESMRLQTATILAHANTSGDLEFERRLTPREYDVRIVGTELTLMKSDRSELRFRRIETIPFPEAAERFIEELRAGRDPFTGR